MTPNGAANSDQPKTALKRDIGWFGSFAMGYADVGADIYVALGLVAAYAAGWAPIAFLIASITYIATGLAYSELATAYPYAGGAQVYSMKAFNDFAGFLAGWLVMLDYTVCTALFAIATTGYLSFFFPFLTTTTLTISILGFGFSLTAIGLVSCIIVLLLIVINIKGIKESSNLNISMVALNLIVLSVVMIIGLGLSFNVDLFFLQLSVNGAPDQFGHISYIWSQNYNQQNFLYAVTLAMSSFIGIESIAQAAEETKRPDKTIPRATKMSIIAVIVFAVGLSALSLGMISWTGLRANLEAPVSALVATIGVIGSILLPVVAFTGFAICLVSSNTGIIGVSRVVFSMSNFGLLPAWFSKINVRTRTPIRTILVFGSIGALMALIGALDWVADLYNFGALLSYLMVNISLIVLRQTDRETHRSWRIPMSVKVPFRGNHYDIPLPSVIGIIACSTIWSLVIIFHPVGRILGLSWTLIGVLIYSAYRWKTGRPLLSKEIGNSILPMTYKMNAIVLIRPEEKEDVVEAIRDSLDTRFRLTLLSIIRPDQWQMTLEVARQYKELARHDLWELARELSSSGFETDIKVQLGRLNKVISLLVKDESYDFIIILREKTSKKSKRDVSDDMVSMISALSPGKLMVVRK
ncbi:MAG: amino acid permease [Candidatus Thorarchaeota archaeon]